MRLARIALMFSIVFLGAPAVRAQTAHSDCGDSCGSQACQQGCGCQSCGAGCGLMSGLTAKLQSCFGGILPGHPGSDARHKTYRAALQRNTFDKKYLLPVPYYCHILPLYRHDRCCCGSTPVAGCPTCGPHGAVSEEVIEMHEVPQPMPSEPTPAITPQTRVVPGTAVPVKEAHGRPWGQRSVSRTHNTPQKRAPRDRVAQQDRSSGASPTTLRSFTPLVLRPAGTPEVEVRQVSAVQERTEPDPINPLR